MRLIELFPKTIAAASLGTLTTEVISLAIELIESSDKIVDLESDGAYTAEQQILEHDMFQDVKRELLGMCRGLSRAYGHAVEDIGICNSWGNVISHGQSIRLHKHRNSYLSGVFYLTGGSSFVLSNIGFDDIFGFMPKVAATNHRSCESFVIEPEPGGVILFPSNLYHSVMPSKDRQKRYSIAFNAVPLGLVGVPTGFVRMGAQ